MIEILVCGLMAVYYMIVYMAFGSVVTSRWKKEPFSLTTTLMIGFFLFYGLFQVIAVPCTFLKLPLTWLAAIWMTAVAAVVIYAAVTCRQLWAEAGKAVWQQFRREPFWMLVPLAVVAAQTVFVVMWQTDYWDATYYIGDVSLSVYTDTISLYDPLTGELRSVFDIRHCFATYLMQDAVVCRVFGIHPLIETKTIMGAVITVMSNVVLYQIARLLFDGKRDRIGLMLIFALLVNLFTYTSYTSSSFLLLRTYEGKAVLGSVIVPAVIYMAFRLYRDDKNPALWRLLFLLCQSGCAISSSAMMLLPVEAGALALALALRKRDPRPVGKALLCMLPCLVIMALYVASARGLLTIYV